MAIYLATLTKTVADGTRQYIYPKTNSQMVKHGNITLNAILSTLLGSASTTGSIDNKIASIAKASTTAFGLSKIGANLSVNDGVVSVAVATSSVLGVVKNGLNIDNTDGTLSVKDASTLQKGVVKLNSSKTSTSETEAATSKAVNDLRNELLGLASGQSIDTNFDTLKEIADWLSGTNNTTAATIVSDISALQSSVSELSSGKVNKTDFATANAKGIVQIGTNISVSNGVISVASASTSAKGVVQLSDAINSTSTTLAATANAVKMAYDAAVTVMGAASANAAGSAGRVPAPAAGDQGKFLNGAGAWATPYTHPAYSVQTGVATGNQTPAFGGTFNIDQFTSDATGHVSSRTTRTVTIPATVAASDKLGLVKIGTNITITDGVISVANASTSVKGVVQLSDAVNSTSTTLAATANAVKTAYDAGVKVMGGATSSAAGSAGRVPAPAAGAQNKFLRGDGTWVARYTYENSNSAYTSRVYSIVDASGKELAYFDATGDFHITGSIFAANL